MTSLGDPNITAIVFFIVFIVMSLGITGWASRKTRTTDQFYAAGRSVTAFQNGLALAGDYMSAASFLGIVGLVSTSGFDGLLYSIGFLVGWPVVMFLIAEPLRNLGRYTFADVLAARLRATPIRIAASVGALAVITFYLIAQMVGAGNLIRLLFGLPYEFAVLIVGVVMLAYVLFGGMIATTWVQIVKAVMLLGGATLLALLVLARFSFNPLELFARASDMYGAGVLSPGRLVTDPIDAVSLGLALMLGTAGLPHILMRFYTVPDARTARTSVGYATAFIGFFYLLTFILGFGAMVIIGREAITSIDAGGNMAAPLLAEGVGGTPFLGFISAVAFATGGASVAAASTATVAAACARAPPTSACRPSRGSATISLPITRRTPSGSGNEKGSSAGSAATAGAAGASVAAALLVDVPVAVVVVAGAGAVAVSGVAAVATIAAGVGATATPVHVAGSGIATVRPSVARRAVSSGIGCASAIRCRRAVTAVLVSMRRATTSRATDSSRSSSTCRTSGQPARSRSSSACC